MGLEESSAENLYDVVMSTFPNNNANTSIFLIYNDFIY